MALDQKDASSCGICGGVMVSIRGKDPGEPRRPVCPTCLAERMDTIREMTGRDYGVAYQSTDTPKEPTT